MSLNDETSSSSKQDRRDIFNERLFTDENSMSESHRNDRTFKTPISVQQPSLLDEDRSISTQNSVTKTKLHHNRPLSTKSSVATVSTSEVPKKSSKWSNFLTVEDEVDSD